MGLRQSPLVLLLVPAAVLAGHALGYAGADHLHGGSAASGHSHGYLGGATAAAAILAVLALGGVAAGARVRGVSFRRLLALQWAALVVQEGVEHVLAGEPAVALLTSSALWLSLVGQLAAAAGACLLVRSTRAAAARLVAARTQARPVVLAYRGLVTPVCGAAGAWHTPLPLAARGPPALSA